MFILGVRGHASPVGKNLKVACCNGSFNAFFNALIDNFLPLILSLSFRHRKMRFFTHDFDLVRSLRMIEGFKILKKCFFWHKVQITTMLF